jgi:hypothetical protein
MPSRLKSPIKKARGETDTSLPPTVSQSVCSDVDVRSLISTVFFALFLPPSRRPMSAGGAGPPSTPPPAARPSNVAPSPGSPDAPVVPRRLSDMNPADLTPELATDAKLHTGGSLRALRKSISGPAGVGPATHASPPSVGAPTAGGSPIDGSLAIAAASRSVHAIKPSPPHPHRSSPSNDTDDLDPTATTVLSPEAIAANAQLQMQLQVLAGMTTTPMSPKGAAGAQPARTSISGNSGSVAQPKRGSLLKHHVHPHPHPHPQPHPPPAPGPLPVPPLPPLLPVFAGAPVTAPLSSPVLLPTAVPLATLPDSHVDAAYQLYTSTAAPLLSQNEITALLQQLASLPSYILSYS